MFTLKQLTNLKPHIVFSSGIFINKRDTFALGNENALIRWIAKRGMINDWAIYYHLEIHSDKWILEHGFKLHEPTHIRNLVPCDEPMFLKYRH